MVKATGDVESALNARAPRNLKEWTLALLIWTAFLGFIWLRSGSPEETRTVLMVWALYWPLFLGWVVLRLVQRLRAQ